VEFHDIRVWPHRQHAYNKSIVIFCFFRGFVDYKIRLTYNMIISVSLARNPLLMSEVSDYAVKASGPVRVT